MNHFLRITIAVSTALFLITFAAQAQTIVRHDPAIEAFVSRISADSLRSHVKNLVSFGTRHTLSSTTDPRRGIGAARLWVLQQFKRYGLRSGGRMQAYLDSARLEADGRRIDKTFTIANVVGYLRGSDTADKRVYMVSGHLDSRVTDVMNRTADAPGANDDGSGVAAVLECARVLSESRFPASVIFVAFAGEEQGLLGATVLAERAKREGWQLDALLNNDIMGSNHSSETGLIDNTRLRVFSEAFSVADTGRAFQNIRNLGLENDGRARQLARYVKELGERYVDHLEIKLVYRNDRFLRGGDHTPFVQRGFAAVRLTEMNEDYTQQHQDLRTEGGVKYGDVLEAMDFEYLRKNTAVNLSVLANLASAPPAPKGVEVDVKNLTNYTLLRWNEVPGSSGYFVLMRETSSPHWEKKFFTRTPSMRLPYSKDNYFFAVQSVSAAGHESIPVTPVVAR